MRLVVVLVLLVTLGGCAQEGPTRALDAADDWIGGYLAAVASRVDAAAPYVADEVVLEDLYSAQDEVVGRSRYLETLHQWCGAACEEEAATGQRYIGESGAVVVSSILGQWREEPFVIPVLWNFVIGVDGIEARYEREATCLLTRNPYGDPHRRANLDAVPGEDIARAALNSWPEGWVLDRAGQHHVEGSTYDPDAPAVYVGFEGRLRDQISEVWMLASHPSRCPGQVAVRLTVDDEGGVESRETYSSIEALRSCPEQAPDGWILGRDPPVPLRERVTGEMSLDGATIEVRHGTDDLQRGVAWAMGRFEALGLPMPPVTSVAFDPYAPACDDSLALSTFTGATTDVLICADAESLCDENGCLEDRSSRRILLHELAHAWLNANVGEATRDAFVAEMGLSTWDEAAQPWAQRGIEWAAETLAWGLHDEPVGMFVFGDPSCQSLAEGFRLLTGVEPAHSCSSSVDAQVTPQLGDVPARSHVVHGPVDHAVGIEDEG